MTVTRLLVLVSLGSTLALASGCGGGSSDAKDPANAGATVAPPEPAATAAASAGPVDMAAPPPSTASAAPAPSEAPAAPPPFTDEQIAAIASNADKGEIEQAKLAQATSKNAAVKKFAAMMIAHHGENLKKTGALLKKQNITPQDNAVSTQLAGDSSQLVDKLKSLKGKDFDRAYIDAQVTEHTQVLDMLDNKLIPQTKNADFKAALQAFRPRVADHLKLAQDIQATLAK